MPGFRVGGLGGNMSNTKGIVPAAAEYYYTYTWEIDNLFQERTAETRNVLIHAKEMTLPAFTVNKEIVMGAGIEYKFAKNVTWEDVKITWYDTVGMIDVLRRWRKTIWDNQTGLGAAGSYKYRSVVAQYLPHRVFDDTNTVQYQLFNSWPSTIRYGELTYTSSDVKVVDVTVTYDWAEEIRL